MNSIYPVNSFYFTTADTCPLAAIIDGSTWEKVGSSLITSINTNVPVKGNGNVLGLYNDTGEGAMMPNNAGVGAIMHQAKLPISVSQNINTGWGNNATHGLGVVTDASKSGIVGTVTKTSLSINIFKRTA